MPISRNHFTALSAAGGGISGCFSGMIGYIIMENFKAPGKYSSALFCISLGFFVGTISGAAVGRYSLFNRCNRPALLPALPAEETQIEVSRVSISI